MTGLSGSEREKGLTGTESMGVEIGVVNIGGWLGSGTGKQQVRAMGLHIVVYPNTSKYLM